MRTLKPALAAAMAALSISTPALGQTDVPLEVVEVTARPMVYVSTRSSMEPGAIQQVVATAFDELGRFFATAQVVPLGPPVTIYRNWTETETTVDVGFPVARTDADKAEGEILAGTTPGGMALKAVFKGPYDGLAGVYGAIETRMAEAGTATPTMSWEIYLNEPGAVPDTELLTEVYFAISAEDAAKLTAQ